MATREFHFEAFFPTLVTVGDIREVAGGGFLRARGHGRTFGQIHGFRRDLRKDARGLGDGLQVVDLHGLGGAEGDGLRQDERQGLLLGDERER